MVGGGRGGGEGGEGGKGGRGEGGRGGGERFGGLPKNRKQARNPEC